MTAGVAKVTVYIGTTFYPPYEQYCCGYTEAGNSYSGHWPHVAWFCPGCGKLWCRATLDYQFDYAPIPKENWRVEQARCEACEGGEILSLATIDIVGPALLRRELEILLTQYEKGAPDGSSSSIT